LIAGADSRNASAAAGVTPRRTRAPAMGTDPHSHPGSTTPATPAAGRRGRLAGALPIGQRHPPRALLPVATYRFLSQDNRTKGVFLAKRYHCQLATRRASRFDARNENRYQYQL
jgi:hypothetical protein